MKRNFFTSSSKLPQVTVINPMIRKGKRVSSLELIPVGNEIISPLFSIVPQDNRSNWDSKVSQRSRKQIQTVSGGCSKEFKGYLLGRMAKQVFDAKKILCIVSPGNEPVTIWQPTPCVHGCRCESTPNIFTFPVYVQNG